jgi:hypothetical protein
MVLISLKASFSAWSDLVVREQPDVPLVPKMRPPLVCVAIEVWLQFAVLLSA